MTNLPPNKHCQSTKVKLHIPSIIQIHSGALKLCTGGQNIDIPMTLYVALSVPLLTPCAHVAIKHHSNYYRQMLILHENLNYNIHKPVIA